MTWNVTQLRDRFARRDRTLEGELTQLSKKASQNDSYKRIHDRQLGEHQVFIILSMSNALSTRHGLLIALRVMREGGPQQVTGAFDPRNVKSGWDEALDALWREFSDE